MATTICAAFSRTKPKACSEIKMIPTNSPDNTLFHKQKTDTEKYSNRGLFLFVVIAVVLVIILVILYQQCMGNKLKKYFRTGFRKRFKDYTAVRIRSSKRNDE